jgi:hypothetical protein
MALAPFFYSRKGGTGLQAFTTWCSLAGKEDPRPIVPSCSSMAQHGQLRMNRRAALVLDSSEALLGGLVRVGELSAERLVSELASGEAEILVPSFEVALGKSENWPSPKAWL